MTNATHAHRLVKGIDKGKRIVVKIGSSLLVSEGDRAPRRDWLDAMADDLAAWRKRGREILVVSSGAIAIGRLPLGFDSTSLRLEECQAAAAAGQIRLAHAWQEALGRHSIAVAQVLLTLEDTEARRRYLNARTTLNTLLSLGAIPVINENDTVATEEIRFGDNDRLAARVAQMVSADTLVLLSDIDGLYTADPNRDAKAEHMEEIREITAAVEAMAGTPSLEHGTGGMVTKLQAARIAMAAGCRMVIANGHDFHPLQALEKGGRCTWFLPSAGPKQARKQWIEGGLRPSGNVTVDAGAVTALKDGRSLLPAGVTGVEGSFARGDAIIVKGPDGSEIGRGISAYSSDDAARILGRKSRDIEAILGYRGRDEMIHRDDLVLR
ncbi:MAG: glutamate 5-kinase [Alphaproteobacteria bacterium]|nr:glutamate 5-kinase [Alphaproteobacteria bacterium]